MTELTVNELAGWTIDRLQTERKRAQAKRDKDNELAIAGDEIAMWNVRDHDDFLQAIDTELARRNEATNDEQETSA